MNKRQDNEIKVWMPFKDDRPLLNLLQPYLDEQNLEDFCWKNLEYWYNMKREELLENGFSVRLAKLSW